MPWLVHVVAHVSIHRSAEDARKSGDQPFVGTGSGTPYEICIDSELIRSIGACLIDKHRYVNFSTIKMPASEPIVGGLHISNDKLGLLKRQLPPRFCEIATFDKIEDSLQTDGLLAGASGLGETTVFVNAAMIQSMELYQSPKKRVACLNAVTLTFPPDEPNSADFKVQVLDQERKKVAMHLKRNRLASDEALRIFEADKL